MDPQEVVASANRRIELLEFENKSLRENLRTARERTEFTACEIKALKTENGILRDKLGPDKEFLLQELERMQNDLALVTGENEGYQMEIQAAESRIEEAWGANRAMFARCEVAEAEVWSRGNYILALQMYIHFIERVPQAMAASTAAVQMTADWYEKQLPEATGSSDLSNNVKALEERVRSIEKERAQQKAEEKESTIQPESVDSDLLAAQKRHTILQRSLFEVRGRLSAAKVKSHALISARDSLNKELVGQNKRLQTKLQSARGGEKRQRNNWKAATGEISSLERLLKDKDKEVQDQQTIIKELQESIGAQETDCRIVTEQIESLSCSLTFYRDQDANSTSIIAKMQRRIVSLQDMGRSNTLAQMVRDQQADLSRYHAQLDTLRKQCAILQATVAKTEELAREEMAAANAVRRENAQLRGGSLVRTSVTFEALARTKQQLTIHILETVFGQLGEVNSFPAASRTVESMHGFLDGVYDNITDYVSGAIIESGAIRQLIFEIKSLIPTIGDKTDTHDHSRLQNAMVRLMTDVSALLKAIRREVDAHGTPSEDVLQTLGFLKPKEFLFGGSTELRRLNYRKPVQVSLWRSPSFVRVSTAQILLVSACLYLVGCHPVGLHGWSSVIFRAFLCVCASQSVMFYEHG